MVQEWITAATALRYLSDQPYTYNEERAICERAHSGLIAATAETLIWNGEQQSRCKIPKEFWWAEGHEALVQNWETGDFSTSIDHKIEVKAFGVSFDFPSIMELLPAERRAAAMHRISVAGDPEWIRADDLTRLIYARTPALRAGDVIVEACALGQLVGRAMRVTSYVKGRYGDSPRSNEWAAIEWDVPLWFWRDFLKSQQSAQSWSLNKVKGNGVRDRLLEAIELQGLHFHRSGLAAMGLSDPAPEAGPRSVLDRGDKPPLSEADLQRWWSKHSRVRDGLTQDELLVLIRAVHPENYISRDRIRALAGERKRGPKPLRGKLPA